MVGLALGFLLLGPASAQADGFICKKYLRIGPNTSTVLSSVPSVVCAVEAHGGPGHGSVFDSPDGLATHGQARFVAEPSVAVAGESFATGKIDRFTEFGLAVETSFNTDVLISWDEQ